MAEKRAIIKGGDDKATFDVTCNRKQLTRGEVRERSAAGRPRPKQARAENAVQPRTELKRFVLLCGGLLCFSGGYIADGIAVQARQAYEAVDFDEVAARISSGFSSLLPSEATVAKATKFLNCAMPEQSRTPACMNRELRTKETWRDVTQGGNPAMAFHLYKRQNIRIVEGGK